MTYYERRTDWERVRRATRQKTRSSLYNAAAVAFVGFAAGLIWGYAVIMLYDVAH